MMIDGQKLLANFLKENNISDTQIQDVIDSGYFMWNRLDLFSRKITEEVMDSFYGNKQFSGFLNKENFVSYLKNGAYPTIPNGTQVLKVKSDEEIKEIINSERIKRYLERGKMSFRGQLKEYKIMRKIPNPVRKLNDGYERIILPSLWRDYIDKPLSSRPMGNPSSILISNKAANLFNNYSSNELNQSRFREALVNASFSSEPYNLEQHYGFKTTGIDVTFDINVATFFATNKFYTKANGKSDFCKLTAGEHTGVIYLFVFRDPDLPQKNFLMENFNIFKHLNPLRPIRQYCALPGFNFNNINAAVCDLDTIIFIDKDAEIKNRYSKEYLFPNTSEDLFYSRLLDLKTKDNVTWKDVVEYEF